MSRRRLAPSSPTPTSVSGFGTDSPRGEILVRSPRRCRIAVGLLVALARGRPTRAPSRAQEMTRMQHPEPVARRLHDLTEPISLVNFFAEEPNESMAALGFRNYWDG